MSATNRTITSANSSFVLTASGVFSAQKLQGYAADDAFSAESPTLGEVVMGVDGTIAAGFVPYMIPQSINLLANSPSVDLFDQLIQAETQVMDKIVLSATISIPSTGKIYSLSQGYLTKGQVLPSAKKTLEAQKYEITWGKVTLQGAN